MSKRWASTADTRSEPGSSIRHKRTSWLSSTKGRCQRGSACSSGLTAPAQETKRDTVTDSSRAPCTSARTSEGSRRSCSGTSPAETASPGRKTRPAPSPLKSNSPLVVRLMSGFHSRCNAMCGVSLHSATGMLSRRGSKTPVFSGGKLSSGLFPESPEDTPLPKEGLSLGHEEASGGHHPGKHLRQVVEEDEGERLLGGDSEPAQGQRAACLEGAGVPGAGDDGAHVPGSQGAKGLHGGEP